MAKKEFRKASRAGQISSKWSERQRPTTSKRGQQLRANYMCMCMHMSRTCERHCTLDLRSLKQGVAIIVGDGDARKLSGLGGAAE